MAEFPTHRDGVFSDAVLTVCDSLGACTAENFTVVVDDVDPIAQLGGPHQVLAGAEVSLDGSGSRAGSLADPISDYVWHFGDNTQTRGAHLDQVTHRYDFAGIYQVTLQVFDEDSSNEATVEVRVLATDNDHGFDTQN